MASLKQALVLLSIASLAFSSPVDTIRQRATSLNSNTGNFTTNTDPYHWAAIGDSFSAGPGAGDPYLPDYGCRRRTLSYPAQLQNDFPFDNPVLDPNFLSCTGATSDDVIDKQIPYITDRQRAITLSVGGNDVGFTSVLLSCVYFSGDCDGAIDSASTRIQNDLPRLLEEVLAAIVNKFSGTPIFVELYPNFFNVAPGSEWCNGQSMSPFGFPALTEDLRRRLNDLTTRVRDLTRSTIDRFNEAIDIGARIYAMDWDDTLYNGHRFCEEADGGRDGNTKFDNENVWFFTPLGDTRQNVSASAVSAGYDHKTCMKDPKFRTSLEFAWYCNAAIHAARHNGEGNRFDDRIPRIDPGIKTFHPKPAAYTAIKNQHKDAIRDHAAP